jgi:hypothetical protein
LKPNKLINLILTIIISLVWLINGLFCKVLNFVPRHELIVSRILGNDHAAILTKLIGASEILVFVWVISRIQSRWCALFQITIVLTMNLIEFIVVPDLLLFGRFNLIVALCFVVVVYVNEFVLNDRDVKYA